MFARQRGRFFILTFITLLSGPAVPVRAVDPSATLWFDKPSARFQQSLPLGNGRIGATLFGGVEEEQTASAEPRKVSVRVHGEPKTIQSERS